LARGVYGMRKALTELLIRARNQIVHHAPEWLPIIINRLRVPDCK
jgi:hypothetical protein